MKCIICGKNIDTRQHHNWYRVYTKSSGYTRTRKVHACNSCGEKFDEYLFKLSDLQTEGKYEY